MKRKEIEIKNGCISTYIHMDLHSMLQNMETTLVLLAVIFQSKQHLRKILQMLDMNVIFHQILFFLTHECSLNSQVSRIYSHFWIKWEVRFHFKCLNSLGHSKEIS